MADIVKKTKLRPTNDIVNRIIHDEKIQSSKVVVGYLDRFDGIIERDFDAFNWKDSLCDVDLGELAIPMHRIYWFKYDGVVIWDRDNWVDRVFGSGSTGDDRIEFG